MTLYKVIETIKMLSLKHPNVNSAHEGSVYEIMNANPQQKYASVVLTQDTHTEDEVFDNYNFNIFYVDRLFSDIETNRLDIQSTAKNVLSNIIRAFCEEFDAECNSINYHTFTERFADECAGAYAAITISIPKDIYCTEKYWDGNWSAPAIKIVNQDKKVEFTENGVYVIDYDSTLYTGLGKVEVEVNVETDGSYEEGYNEGYLEGETDGYTDGLADGIADGIEQQKSKLESITITENGVYEKEDGYNKVIVDVEGSGGVTKIDVAELGGMKLSYSTFDNVPDVFDFSNVTDFSNMFAYNSNLTTIPLINTANAVNMDQMLFRCTSLTSIPQIDTSLVENMHYLLAYTKIKTIPQLNTKKVKTMESMFSNCSELENIPQLDTSSAEDLSRMFINCKKLKSIPQLDTKNTKYLSYMFYGCENLENIYQFDLSSAEYMDYMFAYCDSLSQIYLSNTYRVKSMENMFSDCDSLVFVTLNTSSAENLSGLFFNCNHLIDVGALDASNVQNVYGMFAGCQHLMHFGGLLNLKCNAYNAGFDYCPDLTYQSCINILNGLHNFTVNGEDNTDAVLGVHPNFLTTVGDEISIGTNKGWRILVR